MTGGESEPLAVHTCGRKDGRHEMHCWTEPIQPGPSESFAQRQAAAFDQAMVRATAAFAAMPNEVR